MACPSILSSVKVANSQKEISIASHFQKKLTKSLTVYQFFPNRLKDCDSCIFENGTKIKIWNLVTFNSISSFFVIFLIILCSNYTWRIWVISRKNPNFILKIFFDIMNLSATETESERNTFELIVWKVAIFVCFDSKFVRTFHCPNEFFWRSKLFFREIESQLSFLDLSFHEFFFRYHESTGDWNWKWSKYLWTDCVEGSNFRLLWFKIYSDLSLST